MSNNSRHTTGIYNSSGITRAWLPGCYANLPIQADESFNGYLLRLAGANGYRGISDFLRHTICQDGQRPLSGSAVYKLRQDRQVLEKVGRVAVGDPHHLLQWQVEAIGIAKAALIHGCRVDDDAYLQEFAQVCPRCLAAEGYAREAWDFATVTVCDTHRNRLVDTCPDCGQRLTWSRTNLFSCGKCGADICRFALSETNADASRVSADFAALAPFRVASLGQESTAAMWDTMFRVFKLQTLPRADWATGEWRPRWLASASIEERHRATEWLAKTLCGGVYHLSSLFPHTAALLAPLTRVPRAGVLGVAAMDIVYSGAGILPRELAESICSDICMLPPPCGASLFHGRPPSLRTTAQLEAFLGADSETIAGLKRRGLLADDIGTNEGHDIDEVLSSQLFLTSGLLSITELAQVVGVPFDAEDLIHPRFLRPWNPTNPSDLRYAVNDIVAIQRRLTAHCSPELDGEAFVTAREVAMTAKRPFQCVLHIVSLAQSGGLAQFGWAPPYDWGSLLVRADDKDIAAGA